MTQISAVSREQHAGKRWQRPASYSFTANDAVAPLVAQELPRACMSMPVGFVQTPNGYQLVAVQGLQSGRNLWLAPDGRWIGPYVPAAYRGHPFVLAKANDDQHALCIRNVGGVISESEGEPFFGEDGKPSKPIQDVLRFLELLATNTRQTAALCALLDTHGLIQPWNIQVKTGGGDSGNERKVQGLFRVDETALNALPPEAFEALRKGGALALVYCQLLSMQHLKTLATLTDQHAKAASTPQPDGNGLNTDLLGADGNIRFD
ncbi:MAG: SapC family protein [Burkholderiaceae bacterium]